MYLNQEQLMFAALCYLCTIHFAIDAMAAVTLFLPAAAVGKLQPSIVASLPNTNDYIQTERDTLNICSRKSAVMNDKTHR